MKKVVLASLMAFTLSGCTVFKSRLIPQAYMPDPPAILMKEPEKLHTIKSSNMQKTDTGVSVEGPKVKEQK